MTKQKYKLIENGTLKEYGSKVRRFVERYNWDDIVGDFGGILEEVGQGG